MNRLTRRAIFGAVSAAALAACGLTGPNVQQAISDADIIIGSSAPAPGTGLAGAYTTFVAANPGVVPTNVDAQVQSALSAAPGYLNALAVGAAAAVNASNLSGVMGVASQILNLIAPYVAALVGSTSPVTATALLIFKAATTLLPFVQAVIAQLAPIQAAGAPAVPAVFVDPSMTVGQARGLLALK